MNSDRRHTSSYAPRAFIGQRTWVVIVVAALAAASMLAVSAARPRVTLAAEPVTITFSVESKTYDGTNIATITGGCVIVEETVGDVSCDASGASATFDTKNVGEDKPVTGESFALVGDDAGDYEIGSVEPTTADITPIHLTATITADNKVYNGNANADYSCTLDEGVINDEVVGCDGTHPATFSSKDVGARTATAIGLHTTGADEDNYELDTTTAQDGAAITAVHLTATITASDKIYNGNADAAYSCALGTGVIGTENVTCDGIHPAVFSSKDVGNRTATASSLALGGTDSGNYLLDTSSAQDAADITHKHLTAAITAPDRVYNGTAVSEYTCAPAGVVGTENVTCDGTHPATFGNKHVGDEKTVTAVGLAIGGADSSNYLLDNTSDTDQADISQAPLTVTAVANNKEADGGTTATTTPSVTGTIYTAFGDEAEFVETYDTPATGVAKTLTPSGIVNDGNLGLNYSYNFLQQANGRIWPAPVKTLTFIAQPIDTKTNTAIYSFCVPTGAAIPCALTTAPSGPTLPGPSTPIRVEARDQYGNLAGPGALGDAGEAAIIPVKIENNSNLGPSLGSAGTAGGVATFGDDLKIIPVGPPKTKLRASTTAGSTPSTTSSDFMIVNDLKACDGTLCDNNANNNQTGKIQKAAGQIKTGSDFFVTGTTNVVLSTQFVPGTETNQAACGNNTTNSPFATIGQATNLKVTGVNVGGTAPSTVMVLVLPKDTLKFHNITARGVDTFDLCLGALKVAAGPSSWQGKNKDPKKKGLFQSSTGTDGEGRQWGIPANCGTTGLVASDPCIGLRTKQAATARSYLTSTAIGWTTAQFNALDIRDSDLVIVLLKPPPWDGKTGIKPS